MFVENDPEQERLERERVSREVGDPETITPEVAAWVNERARSLRGDNDCKGLLDAQREGRQRFPDCGWIRFLLYQAVVMKRRIQPGTAAALHDPEAE